MDGKLNNAARYFEYDPDEIEKDDYSYRYDTTFQRGSTYSTKVCRITIPNFVGYHCVRITIPYSAYLRSLTNFLKFCLA